MSLSLWRRGVVVITSAQLHLTKPQLRLWRRVGDLRWWGSLTMVPTGNKAKHLPSVKHTTKTSSSQYQSILSSYQISLSQHRISLLPHRISLSQDPIVVSTGLWHMAVVAFHMWTSTDYKEKRVSQSSGEQRFFLTLYFGNTYCLMFKRLARLKRYLSPVVCFPNKSWRIWTIKLKIGMLHEMNQFLLSELSSRNAFIG